MPYERGWTASLDRLRELLSGRASTEPGMALTRREMILRLPEGEGAGPGAPETAEPVTGRPGAGGHGPPGPGGLTASRGLAHDRRVTPRTASDDARPDAVGVAGVVTYLARRFLADRAERRAVSRRQAAGSDPWSTRQEVVMAQVEESIEVSVPLSTAYNQWTQFEEFPTFMKSVDEVRQIDDTHLHWSVSFGGRTEEFDAVITEQIPDTRIAWTTTEGPKHGGAVDFHRLDDQRTQLMVVMDSPEASAGEKAADALGLVQRRVREDLGRFKEMIESRGEETGAWRGQVDRSGS